MIFSCVITCHIPTSFAHVVELEEWFVTVFHLVPFNNLKNFLYAHLILHCFYL
jgi:hypothetical protein